MHDEHRHPAGRRHQRAQHGRQRQLAPAHADRRRDPVGAVAIGLGVAQATDREVGDREGEHRAEGVDPDEEVRSSGTTSPAAITPAITIST